LSNRVNFNIGSNVNILNELKNMFKFSGKGTFAYFK
jgi:hypothetical protein